MRTKMIAGAVSALVGVILPGPLAAQEALFVRNGESIDLGGAFWQRNCISQLLRFQGVDLLNGPPGLSLSIREEPVFASRQNCPAPLNGGMVVLTAKDLKENFEGTLQFRVRYFTSEGEKQSTHSVNIKASVELPARTTNQLTDVELLKLVTGRTMKGRNAAGQDYTGKFDPTGSIAGASTTSATDRAMIHDTGRWRVSGDRLCIQWKRWQRGRNVCAIIERLPDGQYRYGDGDRFVSVTFAD